ncbi:MAG: carbohydrate porin [Burkholderiales bacterium]|nr:carbohydrate porin [Burkholderiales bacterium]
MARSHTAAPLALAALLLLSSGAAQAAPAAPAPDPLETERRLKKLEDAQAQAERALKTERLSDSEPDLVTRLKAVEYQTLSIQKQARQIEALEGITVGASLTSMVQRVGAAGNTDARAQSRANYRGDIAVTLPGGDMGNAEGSLFTQLRFGQGEGIALRPTYSSTPNTTAFQVSGVSNADSSFAILAQAWYQLTVPLPLDGFKPHSKERVEINVGKIDPFVFFDQNAAADDESTRFTNNVFVHNPLLDSGGDTGADAYGFAPGLRVAYRNERDASQAWGLSLGVFGSGPAANFSGSLGRPFVIAQAETSLRLWQGLAGTYRIYAWRNGRATDADGSVRRHAGWGLSADQRVGDAARLFGRYGQRISGHGSFDRALTLGGELAGNDWRRAADSLGLAFAWLPTGGAWRAATADGTLAGYAASGAERWAELYYRYRLNNRVDLTPDLQWVQRPAGDPRAASFTVVGLRAKVGF